MTITLRRPLLAPPVRWLAVGLALLLLAAAALAVGSLLRGPGPSVVRPAVTAAHWKNGLVAYGRDGDIWVADPTPGAEARVLIGGPAVDDSPDFSPDGTRIAWWRVAGTGPVLMAANADGTDVRQITPEPVILDQGYWWSPDGSAFAITSTIDGMPSVWTIPSDGTGEPRRVDVDFPLSNATWKPDGSGLLVRGAKDGLTGLYPVSWPDLVVGDPIIQSDPDSPFYQVDKGFNDFQGAQFSDDGSKLLVSSGMDNGDGTFGVFGAVDLRTFVMNADGTDLHRVEADPGSDYESYGWFSHDGTRLLLDVRKGHQHGLAIVTLDGSAPVVTTAPLEDPAGLTSAMWSPDGTTILALRTDDLTARLIDPHTGDDTPLGWAGGALDWQPIPG